MSSKSKMASLHHFWTSRQQQNTNNPVESQDGVITLSDSPEEHVNATPLSAFGSHHSPNTNVPSWAPLVRRSTTSDPSSSSKGIPTPLRHISPASDDELQKAGFDPLEGSTLRYPVNESCRQYEIDIMKMCIAENSAVCLPLDVSPDHICAVVVMNFLRWFPRGRAIFCCYTLEAAHLFQERCNTIGIPTEEISIVDTFQTLKKIPTHRVGRLIVTTPQALEKIVESNMSLVYDIRCLVLCLDASESSRVAKYKNIIGTLTMRGILFRVILVAPSVSSTSRKLAPLRKRQQIITSLTISRWIEPSASDPLLKDSIVPLGISVDYYSSEEGTSEIRSLTEKWIERVVVQLGLLHCSIPLPSIKPQQLFTFDWTQVISKAKLCTDETLQAVNNCIFLVEAARSLVIHGPRVFYLYCADLLRKNTDSTASSISLLIHNDTVFSTVYERIQAKYSYNDDMPFNISYSSQSFNSHPKFSRLKKIIEKCYSPVRCLVLCENQYVSHVICESLNTSQLRNSVIRVLPNIAPVACRGNHCTPSQCSKLLNRMSDNVVLVAGIDIPNVVKAVDTACFSQALTRPTDGCQMVNAEEMTFKRSSKSVNADIIAKYNFSYEFSRLQLPSSKMDFIQYIPYTINSVKDATTVYRTRRHGFELTSAEFSEFSDRLCSLPVVDHGSYKRESRLVLLSSYCDVFKKPLNENLRNVASSTLSKRLMNYLNGGDVITKKRKRKYVYNDELVDKQRIEIYDQMIQKLDQLLSV